MVTAKDVCNAGLAISMAAARRMLATNIVIEICVNCGACRCQVCQEKNTTCRICGAKTTVLHKKGSNMKK